MNNKAASRRQPRSTTPRAGGAVTIEMVASLAGVSPSTISRVLNGTAAVSEAKTQAINAAIAQLGYVPNPLARGLAGGRTLSVGVVTQAVDSPYYGAALRGIQSGDIGFERHAHIVSKTTNVAFSQAQEKSPAEPG